ncbi:MAG: SRPBCC family protein [Pseudomonadales bacterium]|nr:SRPBCC family protein [Pseudomonadales bacterium]
MEFENRIIINASAEDVFKLYEDVSTWSSWDPDVKSSSVSGKFETGAVGKLKPTSGPESKILFTSVITDKAFTVSSKLPLCKMTFEHELSSSKNETEVVHKVSFSGFLAPIFGRLIGKGIQKGLPNTLKGLKTAVESKS